MHPETDALCGTVKVTLMRSCNRVVDVVSGR